MSLYEHFKQLAQPNYVRLKETGLNLIEICYWMTKAKILDKRVSILDLTQAFNKFQTKLINFDQFLSILEELAKRIKICPDIFIKKLTSRISTGI